MSASPASATFIKSICYDPITKDYETKLDGLLIGYFGSYHTAEVALDATAYDWLTHGYAAPAAELDDEEPEPVNWTDRDPEAHAASWSTDEPPPSDPLPDDAPGQDIDGVPYPYMRMPEGDVLDADGMRVTLCRNCKGLHRTWQCPDIRARLFADDAPPPWKDVALGRELCRMRWRNFRAFVALLLSVPTAHLGVYAESYVAFIRDYSPDTTLTTMDVLKVWTRIMTAEPVLKAA